MGLYRWIKLIGAFALMIPIHSAQSFQLLTTSGGNPLRWRTPTVPYYISQDGFSDFDPELLKNTVQKCFDTWAATGTVPLFEFAGITDVKSSSDDGLNVIYFIQDEDAWTATFGNTNGQAMAMTRSWAIDTGEIKGFDLAFNDFAYSFTNEDDPEQIETDFSNTLTHEIGHILGLDHSDIEESTMYWSAPVGETSKRDLHQDDIDGATYLYREGFPPAEAASACSYQPMRTGSMGELCSLLILAIPALFIRWFRRKEQQQ